MILRLLQSLLFNLNSNNKKNEPVRLGKQKQQKFQLPLNATIFIIAIVITLFFIMLLLLAVNGMSMTESGQVYNMGV